MALPGVVSWRRPRRQRGGRVAYPDAYLRDRAAWAVAVLHAVAAAGWQRPPASARLGVAVRTTGRGRYDLDRVLTAVLDALQAGGALRDDCLVDALTARRGVAGRGEPALTEVCVWRMP